MVNLDNLIILLFKYHKPLPISTISNPSLFLSPIPYIYTSFTIPKPRDSLCPNYKISITYTPKFHYQFLIPMARGSISGDLGKRPSSNVDLAKRGVKKKKELEQQEQQIWEDSINNRGFKCERQVERLTSGKRESEVTRVIPRR